MAETIINATATNRQDAQTPTPREVLIKAIADRDDLNIFIRRLQKLLRAGTMNGQA